MAHVKGYHRRGYRKRNGTRVAPAFVKPHNMRVNRRVARRSARRDEELIRIDRAALRKSRREERYGR